MSEFVVLLPLDLAMLHHALLHCIYVCVYVLRKEMIDDVATGCVNKLKGTGQKGERRNETHATPAMAKSDMMNVSGSFYGL